MVLTLQNSFTNTMSLNTGHTSSWVFITLENISSGMDNKGMHPGREQKCPQAQGIFADTGHRAFIDTTTLDNGILY